MRNNQRRLQARPKAPRRKAAPEPAALSYEVPTEFVKLPSRGIFYNSDHPLCGKDTIEIRFMTAKEEDILSSTSLIEQGVAVERFLSSVIVEDVDPNDLLLADRSAIMIAARISGYGADYKTTVTCPSCTEQSSLDYDLNKQKHTGRCFDEEYMEQNSITINDQGVIEVVLPVTQWTVSLKILVGSEQDSLLEKEQISFDNVVTSMLKIIISSINDVTDVEKLNEAIDNLPAKDSKFLRTIYPKMNPAVELKEDFVCPNCGYKKEMEVPFTAAFFWPE